MIKEDRDILEGQAQSLREDLARMPRHRFNVVKIRDREQELARIEAKLASLKREDSDLAADLQAAREGLAELAREGSIPWEQVKAELGIEQTPGVCGGDACIRQTRIAVWMLESWRRLGLTEADLLRNYPGLTARDLENAWAYVAAHGDEIEDSIRKNDEEDDQS